MKKKFISVVTALMVLAMGTTVSAASPTTQAGTPEYYKAAVESVTNAEGVAVNVTAASEEQVKSAEAVENVSVKAVFEVPIKLAEGQTVTLTFTMKEEVGANVQVLHWNGTAWESDSISGVKVEGKKVTATFSSLSPVAIVEKTEVAAASETPIYSPEWYEAQKTANTDNSVAAATTTVTSPKTGENAAFLPMMAVICLAGVVVCTRKVKFN